MTMMKSSQLSISTGEVKTNFMLVSIPGGAPYVALEFSSHVGGIGLESSIFIETCPSEYEPRIKSLTRLFVDLDKVYDKLGKVRDEINQEIKKLKQ